MKNLVTHSANALSIFRKVTSSSSDRVIASQLSLMESSISSRYAKYLLQKSKLELVDKTSWSEQEKEILIKQYTNNSKVIQQLRKEIFELNPNLCQYCDINAVKPIDHYLPKAHYPEYSILNINLIPCCSDCNNYYKKEEYLSPHGNRAYINFYFDPIDEYTFLKATVCINNGIPIVKFNLDLNPNDDYLTPIIRNHFQKLDLFNRYSKLVNDVIIDTKDSLRSHLRRSMDKATIVNILQDELSSSANRFGRNYWRNAVKTALLNSSDFIELSLR